MKNSLKCTEKLYEKLIALLPHQDSDYYQEAKSWYQEKYESLFISRNRYQLLVIIQTILLALAITAITIVMPFKQFVYRLIEVNAQTGEVTQLKELDNKSFSENWAVTRYFINQYVLNRNSYNFEDIVRSFNQTIALSDKDITETYKQETMDSNPKSPINILKKDYYRDVSVIGINKLNDNTALVRFKTSTHSKSDLNRVKTEDWQAVIKWQYVDSEKSLKDRDKNPLGFSVTYYQVSPAFLEN